MADDTNKKDTLSFSEAVILYKLAILRVSALLIMAIAGSMLTSVTVVPIDVMSLNQKLCMILAIVNAACSVILAFCDKTMANVANAIKSKVSGAMASIMVTNTDTTTTQQTISTAIKPGIAADPAKEPETKVEIKP